MRKHNSVLLKFCLWITFVTSAFNGNAQGMFTDFGQNRVQYTNFVWSYIRSENFDAYFYSGGRELATFAARVAEEELNTLERRIDHRLSGRVEIVVYNTQQDYKQANFSLSDQPANLGGITQVSGNRIFVFFDGNRGELKRRIKQGLALVIINEQLFGGNIQERVQNAALLNLPDWYLNGLTSYLAENWNVEYDNKLKDLFNTKQVKKFNRELNKNPQLIAHSWWRYLVEKYGEDIIAQMVYITKLSRNYETALFYVTGLDLKQTGKEWIEYYTESYKKEDSGRYLPTTEIKVKKRLTPYIEPKLKISPRGEFVSFTTNKMGKYKLWIVNIKTGKHKKIHKGGIKYYQKEIDHSFPVMAWHPGGEKLSYIHEKKGRLFLTTVDLITKKKTKIEFKKFDKVVNLAYADNGSTIVLSAIRKGQSDLYLFDMQTRKEKQITNDPFDDLYPTFADGGGTILFASNRNSDSLGSASPLTLNKNNNLDIYAYDIEKIGQVNALKRLSNTPYINETQPVEYSNKYYSYLTEYNGITNRYAVRVEEQYDYTELQIHHKDSIGTIDTLYFENLVNKGSVFSYQGKTIDLRNNILKIDTIIHYKDVVFTYPLTNFSRGILAHDICKQTQKEYDFILSKKRYSIYESTIDKRVEETGKKTETYPNMYRLKTGYATKPFVVGEAIFKPRFFEDGTRQVETITKDSTPIDTFFFVNEFTPENFNPQDIKPTFKTESVTSSKYLKVTTPRYYYITFFPDKLFTQLDNSVLNSYYQPITPGGESLFNNALSTMFKYSILDLFEDYRITGGFRFPLNFSGADYFLSYETLKRRLDHKITAFRQGREGSADGTLTKNYVHELRYELKYPINPILSIRGNVFSRWDRSIYKGVDNYTLTLADEEVFWSGYKAEIVFDNTIPKGINLLDGTRAKIFFEQYINTKDEKIRLNAAGFDFRNYLPIHRNIIFCTRLTANTSWGERKVKYVMGGVDNWLFAKSEDNNTSSSNEYAFQALATNMRGFNQNIRSGNTFAAASAELRIPIASYIANRPIRSDFWNNFMIMPFFDIGTAWTGNNPYGDENTFNQKVYQIPNLKVTVYNIREPLIAGFGPGFRSKIMGYYVRFDVAWGIQDMEINKKPVYYFSLVTDF
ncbi:MAG: hypothetical protein IT246_05885 [Bacteroidia bacterium]|nr:hypothetical protein [Bacteroidia bacterium]